ncbi:hypothetical protein ACOMHN_021090 [Nucella lapillus]
MLEAHLARRAARVRVREVDCRKVLEGDEEEVRKANARERVRQRLPSDRQVRQWAGNCSRLVQHYGFLTDSLTPLERDFSIAYSLVVYNNAFQVMNLLRAIYRPRNWYCVHVDNKSEPAFRQAMEAMCRCFPNVFLASRAVDVRWGLYSVLEPELVCMEDLWRNSSWKYFINLTGQEFPLRTNYELVRILSAYNGANDIAGFLPDKHTIWYRWKRFLPAPHNISLYKGSVHIVASRGFVDYILHSPIARDFREWCKPTRHPDEHFFNSLNHNPHLRVPGGGAGKVIGYIIGRKGVLNPSVARYKNWLPSFPCPGHKVVRTICILNVLDLPLLHTRKELFANKFYADYSRVALQCLAEELHNSTTEQALGRLDFNVTFYEQQPLIKNRLW